MTKPEDAIPLAPSEIYRPGIRRVVVHIARIAIFFLILLTLRLAHRGFSKHGDGDSKTVSLSVIQSMFPTAVETNPMRIPSSGDGTYGQLAVNADQEPLGYVLQTSPTCDHIVGYSGPTNCLIALDMNHRIRGVKVLSSGDTTEHVKIVEADQKFFSRLYGFGFDANRNDANQAWNEVDGVSGATLTSYAIIASIAKRTTGDIPLTKFDPRPNLEKLKQALPATNSIQFDESTNMWAIQNSDREMIGSVLLTTPYADSESGYQGPTATAIVFGKDSQVVSVYVDQTFENQPYADYLNDDYPFQDLFQGLTRTELANLDIDALGVEGVSGATMTSMNVAHSIPFAATRSQISKAKTFSRMPTRSWISYWPDATTIAFVICGAMFSISSFKYRRFVRIIFQLALIVFLGFINGHVLSQALIAGWATSTIPWSVAPGLVFLTVAAFAIPMFSRHQPYCHQICPMGALQQLAKNRLPIKNRDGRNAKRIKLHKKMRKALEAIPFCLLLFVVVVVAGKWQFNLASIEAFDAFAFRVAGWATIAVFAVGMIASLFVPMAYCRFGCPTGTVFNFIKFRGDSDRLGLRDAAAIVLLLAGWITIMVR